ncbi:MAG: hypothetical protein AB1465_06125 [Patescibacteria group bacterium]
MDEPKRDVIIVTSTKSMGVALFLTILFGPLGMFYVTIPGGIVMSIIAFFFILIALITAGIGIILIPFFVWLPCIIWTVIATKKYNEKLMQGKKYY